MQRLSRTDNPPSASARGGGSAAEPSAAHPAPPTPEERALLAEELAPIVDRLGRLLTDIAPHLRGVAAAAGEVQAEESRVDDASSDASAAVFGATLPQASRLPTISTQAAPRLAGLNVASSPASPVHDRSPAVQMQSPNPFTNLVTVPPPSHAPAQRERSFGIHIHAFVTPFQGNDSNSTTRPARSSHEHISRVSLPATTSNNSGDAPELPPRDLDSHDAAAASVAPSNLRRFYYSPDGSLRSTGRYSLGLDDADDGGVPSGGDRPLNLLHEDMDVGTETFETSSVEDSGVLEESSASASSAASSSGLHRSAGYGQPPIGSSADATDSGFEAFRQAANARGIFDPLASDDDIGDRDEGYGLGAYFGGHSPDLVEVGELEYIYDEDNPRNAAGDDSAEDSAADDEDSSQQVD